MKVTDLTLTPYSGNTIFDFTSAPAGMGIAFVPAAAHPVTASITLDKVWPQGITLFCDAPLPKPGAAGAGDQAARLLAALKGLGLKPDSGLLWVAGVADILSGKTNGPSSHSFVPLKTVESSTIVAAASKVHFANYHLGLVDGTTVTFDVGSGLFTFANISLYAPTLFFGSSTYPKFGTLGQSIRAPLTDPSKMTVNLSLNGADCGCWQFPLTLEQDTGRNLKTDMEMLNAGIHYYYPSPPGGSDIKSLYYPVFDTATGPLTFYANLDPLQVTNPDRTYIALQKPGSNTPPKTPSCFSTRVGFPLLLQPEAEAKLILNLDPTGVAPSPGPHYCWVPTGHFTIVKPDHYPSAETELAILGGIQGTELFVFNKIDGNQLYFAPGHPAFTIDPTGKHGITLTNDNQATTAWLCFVPASSSILTYDLQSPHALFYQVEEPGEPWDAFELPFAVLK
ncbi:MAG: hypothetical protein AAF629_26865, partial [Chloroflexota bacterium]